jgi:hypothetical protein
VGLGILGLCLVYYLFWVKLLPQWGGYHLEEEVEKLAGGVLVKKLVKVRNSA